VSFSNERSQSLSTHDVGFLQEFQPKDSLIRLFKNDAEPGHKFCPRPATTGRLVISSDRSTGAQKLPANNPRFLAMRKGLVQTHYPQCKFFRLNFEIATLSHAAIIDATNPEKL
jgi:hypothetical protein